MRFVPLRMTVTHNASSTNVHTPCIRSHILVVTMQDIIEQLRYIFTRQLFSVEIFSHSGHFIVRGGKIPKYYPARARMGKEHQI